MMIHRRDFLILTTTFAAGCASAGPSDNLATGKPRTFNAGPIDRYAVDGVYGTFRDKGFFIVRQGQKLLVLSSTCTHKKCRLRAEPDHSFYCPCHGSTFDPSGHVTKGPARQDLPLFDTSVNENGQLLVSISSRRKETGD
jgi:Rieske Fe-S protein